MEKEILVRINLAKVDFTYVEEEIAEYFTAGRPPLNIHELAKTLSVSSSSITRFCKKVGLKNYKELMYLYEKHLHYNQDDKTNHVSIDLRSEYFRIFNEVVQFYDEDAIKAACASINEHRIINIFALGLSATAAQDFKFRFLRTGKFIEVIHDKDAIGMSAQVLKEGDLVLIFTLRGSTYLEEVAELLKSRGVIVICIIANKKSRLTRLCDIVLYTASLSGEESTGMISSQIPILMIIDILYYQYAKMYSDAIDNWALTEKILIENK